MGEKSVAKWNAWVFRHLAKEARSGCANETDFWRRVKDSARFWCGWWRTKDGAVHPPKEGE